MLFQHLLIRTRSTPLALLSLFTSLLLTAPPSTTLAESTNNLPTDLTEIGLHNLLNFDLEVTLPGRKKEKLSRAASAAFVLTNEDIRRSGARHITDALRLIPGVNVAQAASNKWAVSIRGFNQIFSNQLLVLLDGVSIFSPTTNGVYWESNEFVLEDIDRIEVIRGPGATLWGGNALNGVINIITKNAQDTVGSLVSAGGGTHERHFISARQGEKLSDNTFARVFASSNRRTQNEFVAGGDSEDDWESYTAGVRVDSKLNEQHSLRFTTDIQSQKDTLAPTTPLLTPPYSSQDAYRDNTEWFGTRSQLQHEYQISDTSAVESILSYSRKKRKSTLVDFHYDQINLDTQAYFEPVENHTFVTGARYRFVRNSAVESPAHQVDPLTRSTNLVSFFFHDDWALFGGDTRLIFGAKLEHNEHTDFEFMPNVRFVTSPAEDVTVWGAVSRAVAVPAIFFEDTSVPTVAFPNMEAQLPQVISVTGTRNIESEKLIAYETGFRASFSSDVSLDVALFYNDYNDLMSIHPGDTAVGFSPLGGLALNTTFNFANGLTADSYGGEISLAWRALDTLNLSTNYSYIDIEGHRGLSEDMGNEALIEQTTPHHQASLQARIDLSQDVELDLIGRYVDLLAYGDVDSYTDLTIRLGWAFAPDWELILVGKNLLHDQHHEFTSNLFGPPPIEIERSFYGMIRFSH